jgi:hypothetical protein
MDDLKLASKSPHATPEEVVQEVLMEAYGEAYEGRVTSPVRRQAQKITNALRRHGWRILR